MTKKIKKIIAIAGLAGSGKTTVGELVAKKLNYKLISPSFKDLAKKNKVDLMEIQKRANKNFNIDKEFDKHIRKLAKKQKVVLTTWLGPWIIKGKIFRVWLGVDQKIRAQRIAKREKIKYAQALEHIKRRDKDNILRYKKIYNINITDHNKFDLIIDANNKKPLTIANMIIKEYKKFLKEG